MCDLICRNVYYNGLDYGRIACFCVVRSGRLVYWFMLSNRQRHRRLAWCSGERSWWREVDSSSVSYRISGNDYKIVTGIKSSAVVPFIPAVDWLLNEVGRVEVSAECVDQLRGR